MMVGIGKTAMLSQRRQSAASDTVAPFGHCILVSGRTKNARVQLDPFCECALTLLIFLWELYPTWRLVVQFPIRVGSETLGV